MSVEDFDFSTEWLITAMNTDSKQVHFESRRDSDLEMVLDFRKIGYLNLSVEIGYLDPETF